MDQSGNKTRKEALGALIVLPALAAMFVSNVGVAQAKVDRSQFKYQDKPGTGGAQCSTCQFFIAGKTATAAGQCQLITGNVSPHGWCTAYNKKAK
jgi:hypothetical protein